MSKRLNTLYALVRFIAKHLSFPLAVGSRRKVFIAVYIPASTPVADSGREAYFLLMLLLMCRAQINDP